MFNRVKEYINDNEFRLTIFNNRIHVVNYIQIVSLEDSRISFEIPSGRLIIKGSNLLLKELLDNEVLISGKTTSIEVDSDEK